MKKMMILIAILALILAIGCGQKAEETDKVPVETKEAEAQDTTRLDSVVTEVVDSLKEEAEEAVDEVVEEATDAVKGAVDGK